MYKYILLLMLAFWLGALGKQNTLFAQQNLVQNYINKYSGLCTTLADSFGIPPSLILGVAITESGAGTSRNARVLNNHFGIKAGKQLRTIKGIKTRFRDYETDTASFYDFCLYLTRRKFYPTLKGNFDYNAWLNAMVKSGYSASPTAWKAKIKTHIIKYNLTELNALNGSTQQP
jgi:flagellum-specific peptidoglycan hydrolase FlgJ